jgi:lipoprotein-anchoring transpeptidase ErfK/SrfK
MPILRPSARPGVPLPRPLIVPALLALLATVAVAAPAIQAAPAAPATPAIPPASAQSPVDAQALLDQVNISPGVVDGSRGDNLRKAVAAFQEAHDLPVTGEIDKLTWQNLMAASGGQAWELATISADDARGPFRPVPADVMDQAKLPALGYASLVQMLAARHHTSEKLLRERNPDARFVTGESLLAPRVRPAPAGPAAASADVRVVVSRSRQTLIVDNGDDLLFFAPASVGSERELPAGSVRVQSVEPNPAAWYDGMPFWSASPRHARAKLAPGPNNPLGLVWIDLGKDRCGIQGTAEPDKIGTGLARGCVRLTNWDALTVASLVKPGTPVVFEP